MAPPHILSQRTTAIPVPYSFPPSQRWEGNDGNWSTFSIRVGTPDQDFRVLISTAGQEIWIPNVDGCTSNDVSNCGDLRGVDSFAGKNSSGFMSNDVCSPNSIFTSRHSRTKSSTWEYQDIYELGLDSNLGYTGNGVYGYDTAGLDGYGPSLQHQIVAGIADKSFMFGMFALGTNSTNFTDTTHPQLSFLSSLRNQSLIPSSAFGYTAGAWYRRNLASLTLGGYDTSRFTPNSLSFPFPPASQRLTVGLQAIVATNTLGGVIALLPTGIYTIIDSTVPEIWLPVASCTIFETAFGLLFDSSSERYYLNESTHTQLQNLSPTITFSLGANSSNGDVVQIAFPYAAFDLEASWPIYSSPVRYFPLRRAMNDSQYTLGRAFLQEAYLTVDWERSNFSLSQATAQPPPSSNIVAILPPPPSNPQHKLRTGAMVGIIVAVVVVVMILGSIGYVFWVMKRKKKRAEMEAMIATSGPKEEVNEMPIGPHFGMDSPDGRQELGVNPVYEIDGATEVGSRSPESGASPGHLSGMSELDSGFLGHEIGGGTVRLQRRSAP
jgi:cbb3-type cytochrome oxidase subunit 3